MGYIMECVIPGYIKQEAVNIWPVGSRVTCDPPPTDTDFDFLVLLPGGSQAINSLYQEDGWRQDGSAITDEENPIHPDQRFHSLRNGNINLIITYSHEFARRFMAATHVAKQLNLLRKTERILLFQAVLYANQWTPTTRETLP